MKGYELNTKLKVSQSKMASTLYGIADSYDKIGEHELSYNKFQQALTLDRKTDNKQDIGHSLTKLAYQAYKLKLYDDGIEHAQEAISVFSAISNTRNIAWSKHNMALNYAGKGELKKALSLEK
ncbi:tetratricopeptide repeat protein, partial [Pseudoalteromonas phenolica]|uniref:tetratricopeptide repeat protein n=1 Tax=Pseudoalteromonas phenolica TaxID=161398 RepID=UPI001292345D